MSVYVMRSHYIVTLRYTIMSMKKSIVFEQELRFSFKIIRENFFLNVLISKYTQKWVVLYNIYRNLLALRKRRRYNFQYTVTKATQNEALLWKIAVLGREKASCRCRNFLSLSHTGILHSSMPEISFGLRSRTFCRAVARRFRKSLKIKITGNTAGDSPHGEKKSRT
jgi:hypothetical protein